MRSAHAHAAALSLVLNAQHYAAAQIEAAEEIAGRFADLGGDALIVSDLGLVERLATRFPGAARAPPFGGDLPQRGGGALCQTLGARRLILPRDVTLAEATAIAEEVPDIEIEAFVLNDGCIFEEGACRTIHLPGQLGGPICLDRLPLPPSSARRRELSARLAARLQENDEGHEALAVVPLSCGFSTTPEGFALRTMRAVRAARAQARTGGHGQDRRARGADGAQTGERAHGEVRARPGSAQGRMPPRCARSPPPAAVRGALRHRPHVLLPPEVLRAEAC